MKVLALVGSPRKGGNSDVMADEFLRGAAEAGAEVEKVYLDDLHIRPIGDVGDVPRSERTDVRSDDDFPAVLEQFLAADVVALATPVYWAGVSAQMKCFIDRTSSYFCVPGWAERFDGKGYVVLTTFGQKSPDHGKWVTEPMKTSVRFLRGQYLGDVSVSVPTRGRGDVRHHEEAMRATFELGKRAASPA